jgi:uncharacterized surface protein with fasciclin (FAS1) repeats
MMMLFPMMPSTTLFAVVVLALIVTPLSHAFVVVTQASRTSSTRLFADMSEVRTLLESNYPIFDAITAKNEELWKKLSDADSFTLFVPSEAAFRSLGEKKVKQLNDDRNFETTNKVGLFHAIGEVVTAEALFASGGVITMGGEVPVGRSVKGGFFGVGGTEDGGVEVGGCKVTQTIPLEAGIVHEVDGLVSPEILWRYVDQLRIPGSA